MKLFLVTLREDYEFSDTPHEIYVIAQDETTASKEAVDCWRGWEYCAVFAAEVRLIATEGQYGKPKKLIMTPKETHDTP